MQHMKDAHDAIAIRCKGCKIFFATQSEKQQHHAKMHPRSNHNCIYCKRFGFKSIVTLRIHVLELHSQMAIQCNYRRKCKVFFLTQQEKAEHVKIFHTNRKSFKCIYCLNHAGFVSSKGLCAHVYRKHKKIFTKCEYPMGCIQFFKTEQERDQHMRLVHEERVDFLVKSQGGEFDEILKWN